MRTTSRKNFAEISLAEFWEHIRDKDFPVYPHQTNNTLIHTLKNVISAENSIFFVRTDLHI